jgi:16S rRNA (adenine1518-N6/adenine1519-N6)-dimethyltransferase
MAHLARKRFGQHFLVDAGVVHAIVSAIDPRPGEALVEIGPGLGALTQPVLERCGALTVIELDRDLAARWRQRQGITVIESDVLKVDFATLAGAAGRKLRVIGNLPYNISTPILFHLLSVAPQVQDQHFMLQKEVVDRMVAAPSTADYGRLSVMLQVRFRMNRLFVVPPGAFRPAPKVDSAVVRLVPLGAGEPAIADPALFARIVAAAFGQRRKTMRNALFAIAGEPALRAAGIDPGARGEALAVADFVRLANALAQAAPA